MKTIKSYPLLLTALVLTLCLSACGSKDGGQEEYRAPDIREDAVYDPDAQGDSVTISANGWASGIASTPLCW